MVDKQNLKDLERLARLVRYYILISTTPPRFFGVIPTLLEVAGLSKDRGRSGWWSRNRSAAT